MSASLAVRVVRGRKMRRITDVFDEFAAAMQFPLYFGENKDAFDECIAELDWLRQAVGCVVVITEPDEVLSDARAELAWLVNSLRAAAEDWSRPVDVGEAWDRPAQPFYVVLAGNHEELEVAADRWSRAGANLELLR
ncbi:barstar family protein [Microbacterium trichothecenolyticum]|nr:barstar family protein [Microbacterium trichothecenolyticum]